MDDPPIQCAEVVETRPGSMTLVRLMVESE
jgi:hypothetical protein